MLARWMALLAFAVAAAWSAPALAAGFDTTRPAASDECGQKAEWTVIYYSNGDNDLQDHLIDDLLEAAVVGSSPLPPRAERQSGAKIARHIVMLLDTSERFPDKSYRIRVGETKDSSWTGRSLSAWAGSVTETPEVNMADGTTLYQFLSDALACYPGERVALIINGHGSGSRQGTGTRTGLRTRAFSIDDHLTPNQDMDEEVPEDLLYVAEAVGAIKAALAAVNRKQIELVGLDACLMSTIEVGYAFKEVTPLLVASANVEGPQGWKHDLWLGKLAASPLSEPEDVAKYIVDTYAPGLSGSTSTAQTGLLEHHTLVATELAPPPPQSSSNCRHEGVVGLTRRLDKLGEAIGRTSTPELAQALMDARSTCRGFGPHPSQLASADLACVLSGFRRNVELLRAAASRAEHDVVIELSKTMLAQLACSGKDVSMGAIIAQQSPFSGLSVFLPKNKRMAQDSTVWLHRQRTVENDPATVVPHPMPFFLHATGWTNLLGRLY